jgi:hypothetical protein
MKTLPLAFSALAAAAGLSVAVPQAQAQTAARVESQTRPNFGVLLQPPAGQSARPGRNRGWSSRWRPTPPDHSRPPAPARGGEEVVLVDCGGNPGSGGVEAAVARLRPGGSLILRSTSGACVGQLRIDKPLTVIGDAGLDPRNWNQNAAPTLQAPDGAPCVIVSPGVRVTFRDVVFAAPRAADSACIVGYDAEILMNRVAVRYAGDRPAMFADGGLLDLRDVQVEADTLSPGIVADRATVIADELWVTEAVSGIEITAGDGPISHLNRVRLVGSRPSSSFGPRPVGLSILASRQQDLVEVTNSKICGYPDAVILEGARFHIDHSRICGTLQALTVHGGEALVENSRIVASDTGIFADAGVVTVRGNVFGGDGRPTIALRNSVIDAQSNHIWSNGRACYPSFRRIYGNRWVPVWNAHDEDQSGEGDEAVPQDFICHNTAYPREWWEQDEEDLGIPYDPRVSLPSGFDNFQRGRGWYDCRGTFVDSTRYFDGERWQRGPLGFTRDCPRPQNYPRRGIGVAFNANIWVDEFDLDISGRYAIGD